jgi:hypothetical protein
VDNSEIATLRRHDELKVLPDGTEAVPATLQYRGTVPSLPRADRKAWLRERFTNLYGDLALNLASISPTAQTVEVLLPVTKLDEVRAKTEVHQDRLDIVRRRNAELSQ